MNTDGLRAAAERLQYPPLKEAADEIDRLNRSPEHMWLNALSVAVANDRFLVDIGREVVSMLEQSRGRWRAPDDPLLEVTIRFTAS